MFGKISTSLLCLSLAAATSVVSPEIASAGPEVRVAYVDLQRALSESDSGKTAEGKFQEEVKKARGGIDAKKKEFDSLQESTKKQKDSLAPKALAEKEEKLMRMIQDGEDTLRRRNSQLVGELVKKLRAVVDQVGKEDGYTLIFEKGGQSPVLYADQGIDITDKVVKKFNATAK